MLRPRRPSSSSLDDRRRLDSPERALEFYLRLENASLNEVLIERAGKLLRHTYFTQK